MLLFLAFAAILTVTFGTVTIVTSSSRSQRAIDKRMLTVCALREPGSDEGNAQILLKLEPTANAGWFDDLLQKYRLTQMIDQMIIQADIKTTAGKLIFMSLGLSVVATGVVTLWFPIIAVQVLVALIFGSMPFGYLAFKRKARLKKFDAGLADAIDMMGRALRAGHSMTASINVVAEQAAEPVRSEFAEVFKQQNFGLPIRDAMTQMLERVPSQDLRVVVTGILVQKETGGNLAEILDRTAHTIRERLKIQGEIRTHTAQGRMTGWILCALPIVMLVVINFINPGYSDVLTNTPMGRMLSYIGVGLLVTGGLIIRQINRPTPI